MASLLVVLGCLDPDASAGLVGEVAYGFEHQQGHRQSGRRGPSVLVLMKSAPAGMASQLARRSIVDFQLSGFEDHLQVGIPHFFLTISSKTFA